jgi:hypothetical protein
MSRPLLNDYIFVINTYYTDLYFILVVSSQLLGKLVILNNAVKVSCFDRLNTQHLSKTYEVNNEDPCRRRRN